jgi:Neprosin
MFDAFVNNGGDFSLLQSAVTCQTSLGLQTVEAGWINYPDQISQPHIFTYFTTDGYSGSGNNVGGWNQDVGGWVQVE